MKYIRVDNYGNCFHNAEPTRVYRKDENPFEDYKFVIVFEAKVRDPQADPTIPAAHSHPRPH
jgi:hypothetical protein